MDKVVASAAEAVADISDGSTLAVPASPQTLWVLVGDLVEQLSGGDRKSVV